jgi:hypothetical protein
MATLGLIDLSYDRQDGHASGEGEGNDHSHEYLFHSPPPPVQADIETTSF